MAAHVFSQAQQTPRSVEQRRCVQSPGLVENGLSMAKSVGQTRNRGQVDERRLRGQRKTNPRMYCFDRDFSADSAARRDVEIPLEPLEVTVDPRPQVDGDAVAISISAGLGMRLANTKNLVGTFENSFG